MKDHTICGRLLALFFVVMAVSVDAAWSETKVAAVDLQVVMDKSLAGKSALKKLQDKAERERAVLEEKQKAIIELEKELETGRLMMRPETASQKEQSLRTLKREFELYRKDTQEIFQREQGTTMRTLITDIMRVTRTLAEEKGYTLVVEKNGGGGMSGPVILYVANEVDLTEEVITRFDKEQKP